MCKQGNITYLHFFFPVLKGWSVASGDFNGDGKSDVIFGDPLGSAVVFKGRAYVIFGTNSTALPKLWHEESLNGRTGFIIYGVDDMDQTGSAVSSADVNGDGYFSLKPLLIQNISIFSQNISIFSSSFSV
jgi:hypothetical protein